ncbi:MAG: hypothetical protein EBS90_09370, partial [Betaproteobacteria bacterium]|nr:hypothetical protein [Betaproteobacteria bacterium]
TMKTTSYTAFVRFPDLRCTEEIDVEATSLRSARTKVQEVLHRDYEDAGIIEEIVPSATLSGWVIVSGR